MLLGSVEALGPTIRRHRRKLGLTQDDLAARAKISKPYLSLIETGHVANPPSDEKLRKLEQSLGLAAGELLSLAYYHRTPQDARARLVELSTGGSTTPRPAVTVALPAESDDLNPGAIPLTEWIDWPDVADKAAYAARVCDDSMMPAYRLGEIVIFSPGLAVTDGDDCFVRLADGCTTFHRIFFETTSAAEAAVRLQPRNERHRPTVVRAEQVQAMHKAIFKYQPIEK